MSFARPTLSELVTRIRADFRSRLEVFCCAGGMAEGFRRAGITFDWAFDFDPNACESYAQHPVLFFEVVDDLRLLAVEPSSK